MRLYVCVVEIKKKGEISSRGKCSSTEGHLQGSAANSAPLNPDSDQSTKFEVTQWLIHKDDTSL